MHDYIRQVLVRQELATMISSPHTMLTVGKLPHSLLKRLLSKVEISDSRVLLGPQVGEDAALIDMGDTVLVAKTDPITFATDLIGWYAVQVNANDVACMGARPRWFLATILLPEESPEKLAEHIFDQLIGACRELDISLVGGHSEVTFDLRHPIVVGQMLGEVKRSNVVLTSGAQLDDVLILTKTIALEGTALLAREAAEHLKSSGMQPNLIEQASNLLFNPGISIVPEALTASENFNIHSMHDPTEGGIATGLHEIATASGLGLEVSLDLLPILPETQIVCDILGLNPLGLLGSGSLILTLAPEEAPALINTLKRVGINATTIGRMAKPSEGATLVTSNGSVPLPQFPRDEVARYLTES